MEPRKIIKLGNSSFAIALPKDWVDKAGLKKGDKLYIVPNGHGELIIAPKYYEKNRNKTKAIDLSNLSSKSIVHELRSAYIQDNDIVEVNGVNKDNREIVKEILKQEMMGFELIENMENKMIVKDFFNIQEVQLESFLRKIDNSIRSMFEDLILLMEKSPIKDKEFEEMYRADQDINKLYLLVTRIFFKGLDDPSVLNALNVDSKVLFCHWWITFQFEHIADEIKKITLILRNKEIKSQKIGFLYDLCKKINESYVSTLNFCYKREVQLSKTSLKNTENLRQAINKMSLSESGLVKEMLIRFLTINRSVYEINKILMYGIT